MAKNISLNWIEWADEPSTTGIYIMGFDGRRMGYNQPTWNDIWGCSTNIGKPPHLMVGWVMLHHYFGALSSLTSFQTATGWIREEGAAVVDDITAGLIYIGKDRSKNWHNMSDTVRRFFDHKRYSDSMCQLWTASVHQRVNPSFRRRDFWVLFEVLLLGIPFQSLSCIAQLLAWHHYFTTV